MVSVDMAEGNDKSTAKPFISITHGVPYVWNSEDAIMLREKHHICGELIGCHPRFELFQDSAYNN